MFNVILPTYNEAKSIVPMLLMLEDVFKQLAKPYSIIIVDDNSPDGTSNIVKQLNCKNITVIDRERKLGLGSAYVTGLAYCKYPYTIFMDSDLQHDPFSIIDMFKMMKNGVGIVTGTRYAKHGKVCGWSFKRCFISSCANNLARYILGLKTTDLTGSFRIYKTQMLKEIVPKIKCKGFGFQMEIIARAEAQECVIAECPIVFYDRMLGVSKMGAKEIFAFVFAVATLYLI